jgi:hypothetical protein
VTCPDPRQYAFDQQDEKARLALVFRPDFGEILGDVFVPGRRNWGTFGSSVALHVLAILLIPWIAEFAEWIQLDQNTLRVTKARVMRVRLPERLYYAASPRPSPAPPALPRLPRPEDRRGVTNLPAAPKPVIAARAFELPIPKAKPKPGPVILQPPRETAQMAPAELPQMMFWAGKSVQAPTPKAFVLPGRAETAPAVRPDLSAPPVLEAPNQEPVIGDRNIASLPARQAFGKLEVTPSTTVPVKVLIEPPREGTLRSGSIDPTAGDPANVIVLSGKPLPAERTVTVPEGNFSGTPPPAPPAKTKEDAAKAGASSQPQPVAANTGFGEPREGGEMVAPARLPLAIPLQMIRPAANGAFDLLVVQSSMPDPLVQTESMLSGRPIYSVYLKVGATKDWILQYCEPNARVNYQRNKNIVNLGDAVPVKAPYPRLIVAPDLTALATTSYTIIHGMLSGGGQLHDLTVKAAPDATAMSALLPILQHWDFRPATKDNHPIEVEVIFAIPPSAQN